MNQGGGGKPTRPQTEFSGSGRGFSTPSGGNS